jgi:hypothetical protein
MAFGGGSAFRGAGLGVRPGFGGSGYRGIGYPGRSWAYGGYRPYYGGYHRSYGYGGAVAAGLIGGLALGSSLGYYGAPYDGGYAYAYPSYAYPAYQEPVYSDPSYGGAVVYETYPSVLTRPCYPGRGCRADGYPDARYYGWGYGH